MSVDYIRKAVVTGASSGIGREIAKRASAFKMRILGIRRKEESKPEFLDWLGTPERLQELMEQSDFLVVCCDLNSKTEGMLGKKDLESMKKDAVLILSLIHI